MTRSEFHSSEPLMNSLQEILNSPTMVYALAIVEKEITPAQPRAIEGDLLNQMAINGAKSMGGFDALGKLRSLAIPPKLREVATAMDYDEAAVEQMVNSRLYTREQAVEAAKEYYRQQQNQ